MKVEKHSPDISKLPSTEMFLPDNFLKIYVSINPFFWALSLCEQKPEAIQALWLKAPGLNPISNSYSLEKYF